MSIYPNDSLISKSYVLARDNYAAINVDTDQALEKLANISLSLHCWQGDDLGGFENQGGPLGGGLAATGNYPGKARSADELRNDLDVVYKLIPGKHRLNLHSVYAETNGKKVERSELQPKHFSAWVDWAKANGHGLDFNPTCFSHLLAADGFTLSHQDPGIRHYWVEHCIACRKIGEYFGRELGSPAITNIWIPDGYKDTPVDRLGPRMRLQDSLDKILSEDINPQYNRDSVEAKLFGIGSESYVVGSHEFYLGYAITRKILLCLDTGHYHPTETISDKLSSVLMFTDEILLHLSRGVRWDSDHVVTLSDDLVAIAQEIVRTGFLERIHIGLDYFDASINRVAAWTIGARNALRALLFALLEPTDELKQLESEGNYTKRLALLEEIKGMPSGAVWDYFCRQHQVPVGIGYLDEIRAYEQSTLSKRA